MGQESLKALKDAQAQTEEAHPLKIRHFLTGHLGTPLALVGANGQEAGQVAWAAKYGAWGQIEEEYNPHHIHQPIRFQEQQLDQETGLHYNRFRYYDPKVGQYVSQDPIGLAGGVNSRAYPLDPLFEIDPLGLQKVSTYQQGSRLKQPAIFDSSIPQEALDLQTASHIPIPSHPLDKVSDQMSPNRKIWSQLSPFDYSLQCDEWEYDNPSKVCTPLDEKPGRTIRRSTDSVPKTSKSMPLPAGERCNKPKLKNDPADRGSAPTADLDDLLEMVQKARSRSPGPRK